MNSDRIDEECRVLILFNKKIKSEVDFEINLADFIFEKFLDFKKHLKDVPIDKNFKL